MTVSEYIRLVAKIAVLKEVAEEYSGKTIDNIIAQMELIKNEIQERQANKEHIPARPLKTSSFRLRRD